MAKNAATSFWGAAFSLRASYIFLSSTSNGQVLQLRAGFRAFCGRSPQTPFLFSAKTSDSRRRDSFATPGPGTGSSSPLAISPLIFCEGHPRTLAAFGTEYAWLSLMRSAFRKRARRPIENTGVIRPWRTQRSSDIGTGAPQSPLQMPSLWRLASQTH